MIVKTKHKECAMAVELCHQDMVSQRSTSSGKKGKSSYNWKTNYSTVKLLCYFTMQVVFKSFL